MTLQLGVLVSGSGTNLQAILDESLSGRLDAQVRIVISNRPGVYALERAARAGVPSLVLDHTQFAHREDFDRELVRALREAGVEWIALAGFMRVLTPTFLQAFDSRILNIHPSLLPAFPGVDAQGQAFRAGVKVTGCTVHFVDGGVDTGPILLQQPVPVLDDDTEETLRERILTEEHIAFTEGLALVASGRVHLVPSPSGKLHTRVDPIRGKKGS